MMQLTGPKTVYQGADLFLKCANTSDQTSENALHLTFHDHVLPPGVGLHLMSQYNPGADEALDCFHNPTGEYAWNGASATFSLRLRVDSGVPPGWYKAIVGSTANGITENVPYFFHVVERPIPSLEAGAGSAFRPKWEQTLLTLGQKWAGWLEGNPLSFGCEAEVWYYDGARIYLQMASYFKDPKWLVPAQSILCQYGKYVVGSGGNIPGWRKFPFGFLLNWQRTGDPDSLTAIQTLYNSVSGPYINGAAPCRGQLTDPVLMRELAYAIDCMIAGECVGMPRSPYLATAVDGALGMIDQLFVCAPFRCLNQPFFSGLLAEALIAYHDRTKDPRIRPAIQTMCDWYWNHAIDHQSGQLLYSFNEDPVSPTELNNLIAPAFDWAGRGHAFDTLFTHSLDTDISYTGKIFSQNFKWNIWTPLSLR